MPILYDKSSKDFKDKHKKERARDDVEKEVDFPTGKSFMGYFLSLISLDFRKLNGRTFEQAGLDVFNFAKVYSNDDLGFTGKRSVVQFLRSKQK